MSNKVDWSKPVEVKTFRGWVSGEVLKVRDDGGAIVAWNDGYTYDAFVAGSYSIRNTPEKLKTVEKCPCCGRV